MAFRAARGDYDRLVLPPLLVAYRLARDASGARFDPESAARAELAWWVARRMEGDDYPERVGAKIAALYAALYVAEESEFREAGLLRAQAAELRDRGGAKADWPRISELLRLSYRKLAIGIRHASIRPQHKAY